MEEPKKEPKKKMSLLTRTLISLIGAGLGTLLFWFRNRKSFMTGEEPELLWLLLSVTFVIIFILFFFIGSIRNWKRNKELRDAEPKPAKTNKHIILFIIISLFMTGGYVALNYNTLMGWEFSKSIPAVAFLFGIIFLVLEMFNFIQPKPFEIFMRLPYRIMVYVLIPMLPFCIILLGVMQAWYPTNNNFVNDTQGNLTTTSTIIIDSIVGSVQNVVSQLYQLGIQHPTTWLGLSIGAFIILLYWQVKDIFVAKEVVEEELPAEELIQKVIAEDAADNKPTSQGILKKYFEKHGEKRRLEDIKDAEDNLHITKYSVKLY